MEQQMCKCEYDKRKRGEIGPKTIQKAKLSVTMKIENKEMAKKSGKKMENKSKDKE